MCVCVLVVGGVSFFFYYFLAELWCDAVGVLLSFLFVCLLVCFVVLLLFLVYTSVTTS